MLLTTGKKGQAVIPETITGDWLLDKVKSVLSFQDAPLVQINVTRELKHHHSRILFFQAIYASEFTQGYPVRWIAKIRTDHEGMAEGAFYQLAQEQGRTSALPELGGFIQLEEGVSLLLLKNMQQDYRQLVSDQQIFKKGQWQPAMPVLKGAIAELARFHAAWWNSDLLQSRSDVFSQGGWWGRDQTFASDQDKRQQQVEQFLYAQKPSPECRHLLEQSVDLLPTIEARLNTQPLTCVHGDCYPWHFFISRTDQSIKLLDLEFVGANSPAHDLVALLMFWRGDVEAVLLGYFRVLEQFGVAGYSMEQLQKDCTLAIAGHAFMVVQDWLRGCDQRLWKNKLKGLVRL